jgi:hypothetical protein
VLYGVFRWIESVRFWHPRSGLRGLVLTVAATAGFVLVLVSLLGTWGGHLMFVTAVAGSTAPCGRAALMVLGGPATVKGALPSRAGVALVVWTGLLSGRSG